MDQTWSYLLALTFRKSLAVWSFLKLNQILHLTCRYKLMESLSLWFLETFGFSVELYWGCYFNTCPTSSPTSECPSPCVPSSFRWPETWDSGPTEHLRPLPAMARLHSPDAPSEGQDVATHNSISSICCLNYSVCQIFWHKIARHTWQGLKDII